MQTHIKLNESQVGTLSKDAGISAVSIATVVNGKFSEETMHRELGFTDADEKNPVSAETIFGAASLSKPVFAYLVLKLIEANKSHPDQLGLGRFDLPEGVTHFDLQTPLYQILKDERLSGDLAKAQTLTPELVLSHQTGLPIKDYAGSGPFQFEFEPGTAYGYSNVAIAYLQKVIEELTHSTLEKLAQKFVFKDLEMKHSSFCPPEAHAENSLQTTASDYARFIAACLQDDMQEMFESRICLKNKDTWASAQGLSETDLEKIHWGIGWGLQINSEDRRAFHPGDKSNWRGFVAINLDTKTAIVFFAHSPNGLVLADDIISPTVDLEYGLKYIFQKYGFTRTLEPDWQEKEVDRVITIITKYELHLTMDNNPLLYTLSLKCDGHLPQRFVNLIKNEFDEFKNRHGLNESDCFFRPETDEKGNILSLTINIPNTELYSQFIEQLDKKKLLPAVHSSENNQNAVHEAPKPNTRSL